MSNQYILIKEIGNNIISLSRRMVMLILSILGIVLSIYWGITGEFSTDILRYTFPSLLFAFFLMSSWSIWQYSQMKMLSVLFSLVICCVSVFSAVFSLDSYSSLLFFLMSPLLLFFAGGILLCAYSCTGVFALSIIIPVFFPSGYSVVPHWFALTVFVLSSTTILMFAFVGAEYKTRLIQSRKDLHNALDEYRSKEGFIAGLSHHIRTSLSTILGVSEMLKSSEVNDLQSEMIEAVVTGANNLLSLSDEMLKNANIGSEYSQEDITEEFDVQQVVNTWADDANQNRIDGVKFTIRTNFSQYLPKGLTGNSVMLTDVISGIMSAAGKKISATSAMADIFVYDQKETASAVELLVEIHTPLVLSLQDDRANLLGSESAFLEEDILKKLGLIEMHDFVSSKGGKFMIRNATSNLTVIAFTALFWKNHADRHIMERIHKAVQASEKRTGGRLSQANILVVEDNLMNQKVISMALKNRISKIDIANNGKEAIQLFSNNKYDLVLMDLMMPIMDGHKATAKIRELELGTGMRIPIIALTANARAGVKELCIESGMDDFITKPFKIDSLIAKIEEYLLTIN